MVSKLPGLLILFFIAGCDLRAENGYLHGQNSNPLFAPFHLGAARSFGQTLPRQYCYEWRQKTQVRDIDIVKNMTVESDFVAEQDSTTYYSVKNGCL